MLLKRTLICAVAILALAAAGSTLADTKDKKIALSNNYAGGSWRRAMLKSYETVAKKAVAEGIVAAADAFTAADKQASTQAAQIEKLVRNGYDAIIIDASSPVALNAAIKQACDAGVVVVSFDGIVTEPCAWRVTVDFEDYGTQDIIHLAQLLPKGGNLLEIRGVSGTSIDDAIHEGIEEGVEANPQFKIVGSVEGDWDKATTQKAVAAILPSLPEIAGVVDQGGDGFGAAQAFAAAGRPRPVIMLGNRQDEFQWWKQQKDKDGYQTWSASISPGISALAFWVAQQILDGRRNVPRNLLVPYLAFGQNDFEAALAHTQEDSVAGREYTQEEAIMAIEGRRR